MKIQILAIITLAGMTWAQQDQGEPRALKAYLGLSDEQLMQMAKAREQGQKAAQEKAKALQPQMEQKHRALQELLNKPNADATALGKALLEVKAMEKQMQELANSARSGALSVLTQEQRAKFRNIEDAALLPEATRDAIRMGLAGTGPRPMGPGQNAQQGPRPNGPQGPRPQMHMHDMGHGAQMHGPQPNAMEHGQAGPGPQQGGQPRPGMQQQRPPQPPQQQ